MNPSMHTDSTSNNSWPTRDHALEIPEPLVLTDNDKVESPAVGLLKSAVQGAHNTIDHLADSATPTVQELGEDVVAATEALYEKGGHLLKTQDEWAEGARTKVRSNPLVAVAAAFALGAVFARITR